MDVSVHTHTLCDSFSLARFLRERLATFWANCLMWGEGAAHCHASDAVSLKCNVNRINQIFSVMEFTARSRTDTRSFFSNRSLWQFFSVVLRTEYYRHVHICSHLACNKHCR